MISLVRGNSSAQAQGFCPSLPFSSLEVGSGDDTKLLLAVRGVASAIIGTGSKFIPLPSVYVHNTNTQAGYCLCMNLHVLLIDDYAY